MNYWESKFRKGEVLWGFEPSDSAVSALRIFEGYGLIEYNKVNEPVKFMEGVDPLRMWFIVCQKG